MAEDVVSEIIEAAAVLRRLPQGGISVNDSRVDEIIEANRKRLRIPASGIRTDR